MVTWLYSNKQYLSGASSKLRRLFKDITAWVTGIAIAVVFLILEELDEIKQCLIVRLMESPSNSY